MEALSIHLNKLWYQKNLNPLLWPWVPFSWIVSFIAAFIKFLYSQGILKQHSFSVPVIVIGNLTVGGTGKTPLVIHLARLLKQQGYSPAVISRGYGGVIGKRTYPLWVNANSDPKQVGDEPVLLARRLFCPIVVDPNRVRGIQALLQSGNIDSIISDDGLQHYAMGRSIEIVVVDGKRRYGNGFCLPAGPLREPLSRLNSVDFIVVNGPLEYVDGEIDMELRPRMLYNGKVPTEQCALSSFVGQKVHAIAGIGNPNRFFEMLEHHGLLPIKHPFPDHYQFSAEDIFFEDELPVLMTEKDAVKCLNFMQSRHWVVSVDTLINPLFDAKLILLMKERVPHKMSSIDGTTNITSFTSMQ